MKPEQYHDVLVALDQALRVLEGTTTGLSAGDRELHRQLQFIRSQVLKAESGHPFPLEELLSLGRSIEAGRGRARSVPETADAQAAAWVNRIRVLIVDDHDAVRSILRAMLEAEGDFDVIAEATNGREAVEVAGACQPELVIMDLNMPVLDGVSATRETLRVSPNSKVLVFSANRETLSMRRSVEAGARGYICKPATRTVIIAAVREVLSGRTAFQDLADLSEV